MRTFLIVLAFVCGLATPAQAQHQPTVNEFEFYGVWCTTEEAANIIGQAFQDNGQSGLFMASAVAMATDACEFLPLYELRPEVSTITMTTWPHIDRTITMTRSVTFSQKGELRTLYGFFVGYGLLRETGGGAIAPPPDSYFLTVASVLVGTLASQGAP